MAIYVGTGEIIHSSSGNGGVNYLDLNTSRGDWYVQNMVAARRLTVNGRSHVQGLKYLTIPGLPFDPPDRAPSWPSLRAAEAAPVRDIDCDHVWTHDDFARHRTLVCGVFQPGGAG